MRTQIGLVALIVLASSCSNRSADPTVREQLGPRLVSLAETVERAQQMADSARYRVERGEPMREALALLRGMLDELRGKAAELALAAVDLEDPQAAAVARQSVELALTSADDTDEEIAALLPLVDADGVLASAATSWRDPKVAIADDGLEDLQADLAAATAKPGECRLLWDNRSRWVDLVAQRGAQLRTTKDDALRDAFLADPYGEDQRRADAADRECWQKHGALPKALTDLRVLVTRFDELTRADALQ